MVKRVYTPLSLVCIFYFCLRNTELLTKLIHFSSISSLCNAVFFWTLLHYISPMAPKLVFSRLGFNLPYANFLSIHIKQIPARYLPGGIWHTVGRMASYHEQGISKRMISLYAIIESVSPALFTLLFGGTLLWQVEKVPYAVFLKTITLSLLILLMAIPIAVRKLTPKFATSNNLKAYFLFIVLSIGFWAVSTLSFLEYFTSFNVETTMVGDSSFFRIAGSYIFSWGIGYIAVFAPQGIGVFEITAGALIDLPMHLGGALVFFAGFRLVGLCADCITWIGYKICVFFFSAKSKKASGTEPVDDHDL